VLHHRERDLHPQSKIVNCKAPPKAKSRDLSSVEFWRHQSDRNIDYSTHTHTHIALYTQALKPFLHIFWTLFLIKKKRTKNQRACILRRRNKRKPIRKRFLTHNPSPSSARTEIWPVMTWKRIRDLSLLVSTLFELDSPCGDRIWILKHIVVYDSSAEKLSWSSN
jgi:hypothetical protein